MSTQIKPLVLILIGVGIGVSTMLIFSKGSPESIDPAITENRILYWVAPMDPNYKRDMPGESPMGMDLIPVYEESGSKEINGPGTVTISPAVVQNLGVRTEKVLRRKMGFEITTVGYIKYDEDKLVEIHPRIEGWIEKLYVTSAGEAVKKGQPLYNIYSPTLVNAQEELLLALNGNNARLLQATEDRLITLQLPMKAIQSLKKNRRVMQAVTFSSPIDGVVDKLLIREGVFVKPDQKLMIIGPLDEIWVDVEIFERQVSQVKVGNKATMRLDYLPGRDWQGEVDFIYPTLSPVTRTMKVRLRFPNTDAQLKPNMFAHVSIYPEAKGPTLVVRNEAIIRTGKMDRVVMALGDGRFKSVEVTLGHVNGPFVEVLKGLEEGEEVVTSAQFLIDSESSITSDFMRMQNHSAED